MVRKLILAMAILMTGCGQTAPPQQQAAPPPQSTPPAAPPPSAGDLAERAATRDADIARLMKTASPYRRGGRFGLVLLTPSGPALPDALDETAWAPIQSRLIGRFGEMTRLTPMQIELAQSPDLPAAAPAESIRRAGAMQRLDYVLIYRVEIADRRTGGMLDRGQKLAQARIEASVLDVASGGLIASTSASGATAPQEEKLSPEDSARASALAALGPALDAMARDLDAQAMRAAAGGQ